MSTSWDFYSKNAEKLKEQYDALSFEEIHASWLHLLDRPNLRILDVGAGSGRDARALAARGHFVTAVEPSSLLEEDTEGITWVSAHLPELAGILTQFDIVLCSSVWNHINPEDRFKALENLWLALESGGYLVITVCTGEREPSERIWFNTTVEELITLAEDKSVFNLEHIPIVQKSPHDLRGYTNLEWHCLIFRCTDYVYPYTT